MRTTFCLINSTIKIKWTNYLKDKNYQDSPKKKQEIRNSPNLGKKLSLKFKKFPQRNAPDLVAATGKLSQAFEEGICQSLLNSF